MVVPAVDDATKTTDESLVLPEEILVFPVRVRFLPVVTMPDSSNLQAHTRRADYCAPAFFLFSSLFWCENFMF